MSVIIAVKSFSSSIKLQRNIFDKQVEQYHSFLSFVNFVSLWGMMAYISYDKHSNIHNIEFDVNGFEINFDQSTSMIAFHQNLTVCNPYVLDKSIFPELWCFWKSGSPYVWSGLLQFYPSL